MRFGFVGPAYASQSPLADLEVLENWYVEKMESPNARTPYALYPTPGLGSFATLSTSEKPVRGLQTVSGRTFAVSSTHLYEFDGSGIVTDYGGNPGTANNNMVDDGLPAIMVAGGTSSGTYPGHLLISSGGALTVFNLATNAFVAISGAPTNVLMIDFIDGFFIALSTGNTWEVSNAEDATTWTGLSVSQVSVFSDELLSLIASDRLLWIFGARRAAAYYNSGAPLFPFDVVSGSFMEVGIVAQFSVARVAMKSGTTIIWLGGDERGQKVVFAANGFIPTRMSDHALEFWMNSRTVSDAVGFAVQEQGHNFYVLWFPTADATWVLDVDLGFWHRRSSLVGGLAHAHLGRCHTYNFGKHLVGDRNSSNVYAMDISFLTENIGPGMMSPIVRTRVGPTISEEGSWKFFSEFQVDFETGLGPIPPLTDGAGNPRAPLAMFSYSKDFGKTWSPDHMIPCGQAGQFKTRAIDRRLGKARNWTPRVVVSDPIPWRMVDAYVNATQEHQQRLSKYFAKIT